MVAAFWSLPTFICRIKANIISPFSSNLFLSVYLCKDAFNQIKKMKSKYRSRLADEHLKFYLHLCLSKHKNSFNKILIYLFSAIGLAPGGGSTVHIYTQTIHRTTKNKQYIEQHNW